MLGIANLTESLRNTMQKPRADARGQANRTYIRFR